MIGGLAPLSRNVNLLTSGPRPYSLTIDGMDVGTDPAGKYGVPVESIAVTEAGPGGVSSMHFTMWDTLGQITIGDGAEIRLHDNTRDLPVFGGFLERFSVSPAFGGSGRIFNVSAFGYEALLDLIIDPSFDIPATGFMDDITNFFVDFGALQSLCANAPLRAFADSGWPAPRVTSSQAQPISTRVDDHEAGGGAGGIPVIMAGQSIRQAFETYLATGPKYQNLDITRPIALTVDFYRGVRLFSWGAGQSSAELPSDYSTLTVGAGVYATNIEYEEDHSPGAITSAVFVQGAAAASTGWVLGAYPGRREAYTTTTSTFKDDKLTVANAILEQRGTIAGRGSLDLENFTPINAHPGSQLIITDPNMGWTSQAFLVSEISRSFNQNGQQNWHVSFFDPGETPVAGAASAHRLLRTLTRGRAN